MASINTIVKRKQYLWLGIVVVGTASAIGGALYLSDVDMSGNGETVAEQEPVPDMTGVVDTTFDDKVRQHATTEMQVTAAQMQKQYEEIRRELDVLNKQRGDDQRRIEKLGQDNAALAEQVKALGANPVTATGEPVPQMTDYIGYDILLQYIQELIQQARAMVATGNYDEAVIGHINDNMNDATRQIAAFQSQVQVQQDALLVVDRQMSYMRQQLSARMLSRYQNNYHFGGSTR